MAAKITPRPQLGSLKDFQVEFFRRNILVMWPAAQDIEFDLKRRVAKFKVFGLALCVDETCSLFSGRDMFECFIDQERG